MEEDKNRDEFLKDFFEESKENIEKLNELLLDLERGLETETENLEVINSIFRSIHTIKGLAGMVNISKIYDYTHKIEDLLGLLRRGEITLSKDVVDLLFRAIDGLKVMIFEAENNDDLGMDYDSIIKDIDKILESEKKVEEKELEKTKYKQEDFLDFELDLEKFHIGEAEREALKFAVQNDYYIYIVEKEIKTDISKDKFESLPIFEDISNIGEVISVSPTYEEIMDKKRDTISISILFSSRKPPKEVRESLFDPIRVVREAKKVESETIKEPKKEEKEKIEAEEKPEIEKEIKPVLDEEILKEFLQEAQELIENLDLNLLELEKDPRNPDVINSIFRIVHTLKGSSGMFGFDKLVALSHKMENLFDRMRKGEMEADSDLVDLFFKCLDKFRSIIGDISYGKGEENVDTSEEIALLNSALEGKSAQKVEDVKREVEGDIRRDSTTKIKIGGNTIRVDTEKLDKLLNLVGEFVIDAARFSQLSLELKKKFPSDPLVLQFEETNQIFSRHMSEIQEIAMNIRMVPIGTAFNRFPRVVRDLAKSFGKEIDLIITGEDTELDKTIVEEIVDPLVHMIRNCVDHGIELPSEREKKGKPRKGKIWLRAYHEGNNIVLEIEDDGRGIDIEKIRKKAVEKGLITDDSTLSEKEILNLIFEPGFSTSDKVSDISGRGVGMDVVRKNIAKLKGMIEIHTEKDVGTKITVKLPLTLAILQTLLVRVKEEIFAVPLYSIVENLRLSPDMVQRIEGREIFNLRGTLLPLVRLSEILNLEEKSLRSLFPKSVELKEDKRFFVVVIGVAEKRFGLVVDGLIMQQEVVIKSIGKLLAKTPCIAGGTIMGDGRVCLILDVAEIAQEIEKVQI